jgi:hypothetical protein
VPPVGFEAKTVREIAAELENLAKALRAWPAGESTSLRGQNPAQQIVQALKKINATLARDARDHKIPGSSFNEMAREFESIAAALREAAGGPKTT